MSWIEKLPAELLESLPDDIKTNATLNKYESFEEQLKGHINADSAIGQGLRIPGPDAGDEAWSKFNATVMERVPGLMPKPDLTDPEKVAETFKYLGKPEDLGGYEIPESVGLSDEVTAEIRKLGYDADLTNAQLKKLATGMAELNKEAQENFKSAKEHGMAELKTEWGMTIDDRLAVARRTKDEQGLYPDREFDALSPSELRSLYNLSESLTGKGPQDLE